MSEPTCSFCGKPKGETFHMVAGPACYICDACVDLAFDCISAEREKIERPWIEKFLDAIDWLYESRGTEADREVAGLLDNPSADERFFAAGQSFRRMVGELREIRQAVFNAAERAKVERR